MSERELRKLLLTYIKANFILPALPSVCSILIMGHLSNALNVILNLKQLRWMVSALVYNASLYHCNEIGLDNEILCSIFAAKRLNIMNGWKG